MNEENKTNVVSLNSFRQKKVEENNLTHGRKPLYMSKADGKVTGSPYLKDENKGEDFSERVSRIKSSLERINNLMQELKRMSNNTDAKK